MYWKSLKVILWKNYIIRKRHWLLTLLTIIIPTILFAFFGYARSKTAGVSKNFVNTTSYNEPIDIHDLYKKINRHDTKLYYAPNTQFTEEIVNLARLKLHILHDAIKSFDNEEELVRYHQKYGVNDTVLGVVFNINDTEHVPKQLVYNLRMYERGIVWNTDVLYHTSLSYVGGLGSEVYINEGFLPLQLALDMSYLEILKITTPNVQFQEMPYPPHFEDHGINDMYAYVLPLITMFGYVLILPAVLKRIIEEKSTGIKQLMKMMGLDQKVLWSGWFIHALFENMLSVVIIIILLKTNIWGDYSPIEYCNWCILFIFLLMYCIASISLCFFISTLFNKPNIAVVFGTLVWLLSYFLPSGFVNNNYKLPWFFKLLLSFIPNMALHFGYSSIFVYEIREIGIQWHNINVPASGGKSELTMLQSLLMLLIDSILYISATLYIDNIKPGPYGIPKKWNYPLMNIINRFHRSNEVCTEMQPLNCNENIEHSNLSTGINIRKLNKNYGVTNAVNDLNMDLYEGEITVLLGHNGAGKTTTLSILTGMIEATSGTIIIDDNDIRNNIDKIRSLIGICPQHDLVFQDLNVYEHLVFFAKLKGLSDVDTERDCAKLLDMLNLTAKKNEYPRNLSGGMKRKLCLGMALIGDPKVLILDEPTSGLDVEARREIWDILLQSRKKKTTIITTHFMEEAEVLGDRIAIMDHGQLICYGTPFFLKEKFGKGYQLNITFGKINVENVETIKQFVKKYLDLDQYPELKITEHKIMVILPFKSKDKYKNLFKIIESKEYELDIQNIGLSVTTIEYVFLNATPAYGKIDSCVDVFGSTASSIDRISDSLTVNEVSCISKYSTLLYKRYLVFKRKWIQAAVHCIIAILAIWFTLYLGLSVKLFDGNMESSLKLNLSHYGPSSVYYSNDVNQNLSTYYENIVKSQLGIPKQVKDVSDAVIREGIKNIEYYKQHIVVGGEFNKSQEKTYITVMYSNTAFHGAPISWNMMLNAYIKYVMNNDYFVEAANSPLEGASVDLLVTQNQSAVQNAIAWLFMFPLGAYIMMTLFISFPQREYLQSIRKLQKLAGIKPYLYWFNCFSFDILIYILYAAIAVIIIAIYKRSISPFTGPYELGTIFLILILYGIANLPFVYLFSHLRTTAGATSGFLMTSLCFGVSLAMVTIFFEMSGEDHATTTKILKYLFGLLPPFALTYISVLFCKQAVWNYNWNIKSNSQKLHLCYIDMNPCCNKNEPDECDNYMSYVNKMYEFIGLMLASFVIYSTLLLLLDSKLPKRIKEHCKILIEIRECLLFKKKDISKINESNHINANGIKREDTVNDLQGTGSGSDKTQYVAERLKKIYNGHQEAVKDVSFKIPKGKCYGLLGVNGAGKSSVFKMLVGDELMNNGNAYIKNPDKVWIGDVEYDKLLGYCPQSDALNYYLTGRELLSCFAKFRGVSNEKDAVEHLLKKLDLKQYENVPCGVYSGGNKRKLNLGLALIGNPLVQLLDEPTTGVDPASRRKIWHIINTFKSVKHKISNKELQPSILLTSHSMDECEALCDELAIMKNGKIVCQGPILDLKQEYSNGYCIKMKIKPKSYQSNSTDECDGSNYMNEIKPKIEDNLENKVKLIEEHNLSLHYRIHESPRLSWLFEKLDELVDKKVIQDYSVSDATLEEVFLKVANDMSI